MKPFALPLTLALAGVAIAAEPKSVTVDKPNIVLIFIDDMGYADIGPFGNKKVRTPNLDRMATEGMKFTSFYASPVCSASRACLMTGCYNPRVSIPGVLMPKDKFGLNPDEITLAEIVKPRGYATACIGKWHLGHLPQFLPTRQGFDCFYGLPYSNDMGIGNRKWNFPPLPLMRNETVIESEPDQTQFTKNYTGETVKFIRAHKDEPFFVYLPHTMIHTPLAASETFKGKSKAGLLGDAIEEVDWSVGEILQTLKELKLDEKTLVIFTSDNGPAGHRPAPPFRGCKTMTLEGGVREPCIMRWPGKIPAGTTCEQIAGTIDILPTFATLAGGRVPADRVIDGRDISSLLFNPQADAVRDTQLYFAPGYFDPNGKLEAIRVGNWKLFVAGSNKGLYNVAKDRGEKKNMAAAHPEIAARLRGEAEKRMAEILRNKRPAGAATAKEPTT